MDVVVAAAVLSVERDPDVLEYGAVLVFKLRGARSADGKDRAGLFDLGKRKLRRLLLYINGNCDGSVAQRAESPQRAFGVHAADRECDQGRSDRRPARVTRGFPVAQ